MKKYPFKFLDAYAREDKDIFFGRTDEIEKLYEMAFQSKIILVYGGSGTGKTSLIQCGLANKFKEYDWRAIYVRRGRNILYSLDKCLCEASEGMFVFDENTILKNLNQKIEAVYLNSFRPIYFIFDQFEELYILGNKEEQNQFIATVKEILQLEQPIKIILSIREEYLGHLYEFEKAVPELLRKKSRVEAMNLDKVRSVLLGIHQLKEGQIRLEQGKEKELAEQIFDKIKGKDKSLSIQLPYLQVFLDKLYLQTTHDESRQADAILTLETLAKIGDIDNVLRDFLEEQANKIAQNLNQKAEIIWKILSPFVTLEGTKEPMHEPELLQRLPNLDVQLIKNTLKAFMDSRILRFSENEQVYEIAHDSLAKQIAEKRSDEDKAILEVQRLVKAQTTAKEAVREFFTEKQLHFIELYEGKISLSAEEQDWLKQSKEYVQAQKEAVRKEQERELQEAKAWAKRERSLSRRAYYVAAVAILIAFLAGYFYFNAKKAKDYALHNQLKAQKILYIYYKKQHEKLLENADILGNLKERRLKNKEEQKANLYADSVNNTQKTIQEIENQLTQ